MTKNKTEQVKSVGAWIGLAFLLIVGLFFYRLFQSMEYGAMYMLLGVFATIAVLIPVLAFSGFIIVGVIRNKNKNDQRPVNQIYLPPDMYGGYPPQMPYDQGGFQVLDQPPANTTAIAPYKREIPHEDW